MRQLHTSIITDTVARLCIEANKILPDDLCDTISCAAKAETDLLAANIMHDIESNISAAKKLDIPVCQDTGMAVVFIKLGQEVHLVGGTLSDAVNEGVRRGYNEGYLRKSVVADPLRRVNTNDNTPAILHLELTSGDKVEINVATKGFGSKNMSGVRMLTPSATRDEVIAAVCDVVKNAGSNPCPPMVIGVGIGGDFEYSAILAKRALCRSASKRNPDAFYAELELDMLAAVNALGIGAQGFGGKTTALYVNIEQYPTHIAGLPIAVNIGCHVTRHKTETV